MNIAQIIKTNAQIMELIMSKHQNDGFPGNAARGDKEAAYFKALEDDLEKIKSALESGGIAEKRDGGIYSPLSEGEIIK